MHRRSEVLKYSKIINEVSPRLATQVYSTETRRDDVLYCIVKSETGKATAHLSPMSARASTYSINISTPAPTPTSTMANKA